jgi:uncharacterized protein YoxC
MVTRHTHRYRWLIIGLAILITGWLFWQGHALLVQAQLSIPEKDIIILIDNSQSMTTGNEDREPADKDDLRIRIAQFVVRFLQNTKNFNGRVGVITFAGPRPSVRVPLTPLTEWQSGDFSAIKSENEGDETDFATAFETAGQMLVNTDSSSNRDKQIWLFSDGHLDEFNVRRYDSTGYLTKVKTAIQALPENTQIWVVAFHVDYKNRDQNMQLWQEDLLKDATKYIIATERPLKDVYEDILAVVIGKSVSEEYKITDRNVISETVYPYRRWVEFSFLSDRTLTPTFSFSDGAIITPTRPNYYFSEPVAGEWIITFETEEGATIFYKQESEKSDILIELLSPIIQAAEKPLRVDVSIKVDDRLVLPSSDFTVKASLQMPDGSTKTFHLEPALEEDVFWGETPVQELIATSYPLQIVAEIADLYTSTNVTIERKRVPLIENLVITSSAFTEGDSVRVSANIQNFDSLFRPEIMMVIIDDQGLPLYEGIESLNNGLLDATLSQEMLNAGEYLLKLQIPGENVVGGFQVAEKTQLFSIKQFIPPPEPTPIPPPPHITDHPQTIREAMAFATFIIVVAIAIATIAYLSLRKNIKSLEDSFQKSESQKQSIQKELNQTQTRTQELEQELNQTQTRTQELERKVRQLETVGQDMENLLSQANAASKDGNKAESRILLTRVLDIANQLAPSLAQTYQVFDHTYKALNLMLQNETSLDNQRNIICEHSVNSSKVILNSLAQLLLKRWIQQPNLLIHEIYVILHRGGNPELFEILQGLGSPIGFDKEFQRISEIRGFCNSIWHFLKLREKANEYRDISNELESVLKKHVASLLNLSQSEASFDYAASLYKFHQKAQEMVNSITTIDWSPISSHLEICQKLCQETDDSGRGLSDLSNALRAFTISPFSELRENLAQLTNSIQQLICIEQIALFFLAKNWISIIEKYPEYPQAELEIRLAPGLTLNGKRTQNRLTVTNDGLGPAYNVQISYNAKDNNTRDNTKVNLTEVRQVPLIEPGDIQAIEFPLSGIQVGGNAEYQIKYFDAAGEYVKEPISTYIPPVRIPPKGELKNPYLLNRPLRATDRNLFVGREQKIEELKNNLLAGDTGNMLAVLGLRRVGKSSLLNHFIAECPSLNCLPVYIDLALWSIVRGETQKLWTEEMMWGAIIREIYSKASSLSPQSPQFKEPPMLLSTENFEQQIQEFVTHLDMTVVLILDEADLLFENDQSSFSDLEIRKNLLRNLNAIRQKYKFSVIFAHDVGTDGLWGMVDVLPLKFRLELLKKDETEIILTSFDDNARFSTQALEYAWQVTAGYPALVQLFAYHIVEDCRQRKDHENYTTEKNVSIALKDIIKVTEMIIADTDNYDFINYLRYGFTELEVALLRDLVKDVDEITSCVRTIKIEAKGFVRNQNSTIRPEYQQIRYSELILQLINKEVLRRDKHNLYLRMGFMKLWFEVLFS